MTKISPPALTQFCVSLLTAAGMREPDAATVAAVLVDTSLDGIDTHGISRLPIYISRLRNGRMNPRPNPAVERTAPAIAIVDGDNGLGQLVSVLAMETAIALAAETGAGFVTVRHSNHFGAASYYCKMAAKRGMIGAAFTNSPPGIPPWGGRKPYFGTNPIGFGFPGPEQPVIIDLSTSVTARGRIIQAAKEGKPIPEGWAIDADGRPTTDAKAALAGAVLPMAGPKGYALALAVEILAGVASGSAIGSHVGWMYDDSLEPTNIGHAFLAIDIARLMPLPDFLSRMNEMISEIRAVPKAESVDKIYIPGERKHETAVARQNGIPLPPALLAELNECAADLGIPPLPAQDAI